jgi:hypothetical protein
MSGLRKSAIASRIVKILSQGDCLVGEHGFRGVRGDLPWTCVVELPRQTSRRFHMYFWTVSHGGRSRTDSEYRIQVKLKESSALEFGGGTTLLLGYYRASEDATARSRNTAPPKDMEMFIAWDPIHHLRLGLSSSCQVSFDLMLRAYLHGADQVARRCADGSVEQVIAFRSEFLPRYLKEAAGGHNAVSAVQVKSP